MGVAEDVFERLRRITFDGEHVERMAMLNERMKLSPGLMKTLMRLGKADGISMGDMARGEIGPHFNDDRPPGRLERQSVALFSHRSRAPVVQ